MGREVRMVPKGWEHPRDERTGHHKPMHDRTYKEVATAWVLACGAWAARNVSQLRALDEYIPEGKEADIFEEYPFYWEWTSDPPDKDHYRPEFDAPADHFQFYENVSEGTPLSPVFATRAELAVAHVQLEELLPQVDEGAKVIPEEPVTL